MTRWKTGAMAVLICFSISDSERGGNDEETDGEGRVD